MFVSVNAASGETTNFLLVMESPKQSQSRGSLAASVPMLVRLIRICNGSLYDPGIGCDCKPVDGSLTGSNAVS